LGSSKAWLIALALAGAPAAAVAQTEAAKPDAPAKPAPAARPAKPPVKTVDTVTVTGGAPDVKSSIDRQSYTLGKDLQATTGSIADALRNVPSVEVDLQGNLSLRGDGNVTILVDGKPSPAFEGKGRADALQQLPADQIDRVEVISNPSAALNPEGTGGVINLITKQSRGGGVTGSAYATAASAGLKRAGLNLGYNTKTLAITGSLAANYQRNKNHFHDERDGLDPTSGQFLKNFDDSVGRNLTRTITPRVNLTWTATPKDQITGALSYNNLLVHGHPDDHYTNDGVGDIPVRIFERAGQRRFLETDNSVSAGWRHTFGEGHELSVDAVYNDAIQRDNTLTTTTQTLPAAAVPLERIRDDASDHHSELRVAYSQMVAGGALKTGYELRHEDNDADFIDSKGPTAATLVQVPSLANHYLFEQYVHAVYATYQHGFGKLDVQTGLRVEDVRFDLDQLTSGQRTGQHYDRAYPSLHLAYKLDDERKLTASYSVRVQRPPPFFLNPLVYIIGPQDVQQGNPDLKVKEVQIYELGFEQRKGQTFYQASFYFRNARHDFSQVLTDLGGGVFKFSFGNTGSSQAAGVDLSANGKLTSKLSYSATLSPYWNEIEAGPLDVSAGRRMLYSAGGRFNLNWQATADDMVQLNGIENGRHVNAQGTFEPNFNLNFGWRHKVNDRVTATMTAQDLLGTNHFQRLLNTAALVERFDVRPVSRAVFFRLDYRFGGGAPKAVKDPGFEYENGGGPGPG
jgi:outer membrane receptor protein involved in Fe transport